MKKKIAVLLLKALVQEDLAMAAYLPVVVMLLSGGAGSKDGSIGLRPNCSCFASAHSDCAIWTSCVPRCRS